MNPDEWQKRVAQLMRETADLMDCGHVRCQSIDTQYDYRFAEGFLTTQPRAFHTGMTTVKIELLAYSGTVMDGFAAGGQDRAIGADRRLLSKIE